MAKMLVNARYAYACCKDCDPHFGNGALTKTKVRRRRLIKRRDRQAWKRNTKSYRGGNQ